MPDEDGLAAPFDDYLVRKVRYHRFLQSANGGRMAYVFALRNGSQVKLDLGLRKHIRGGGHVDQEICIRAPL